MTSLAHSVRATLWACALVACVASPAFADANNGAKLAAANGCQSCHGTTYQGTANGPALAGIEHRRSRDQIVSSITHPVAPMPNFGFTPAQAGDIADYLTNLDGGSAHDRPVITIGPDHPTDYADVTIRFPGTPPKKVTAVASMAMGNMPMKSPQVVFKPTDDPHVFRGRIQFSMGGAWTIHIVYDGKTIDRPLVVGQ